jgi:hypothetical protein
MTNERPKRPRGRPKSIPKVTMFLEVPPWLKDAFEALAVEHERSMTGEAIVALKEYAERHGKKGVTP